MRIENKQTRLQLAEYSISQTSRATIKNLIRDATSILGASRENRRAAREIGAREQKAVVEKRGEWHRHVLLEFVSLMIFFSFLAAQSNNIDMEDIFQQHVSDPIDSTNINIHGKVKIKIKTLTIIVFQHSPMK